MEKLGEEKAQNFKDHGLMLMDPEFTDKIKKDIREGINAEKAVRNTSETFEQMFLIMDNEYFRESS